MCSPLAVTFYDQLHECRERRARAGDHFADSISISVATERVNNNEKRWLIRSLAESSRVGCKTSCRLYSGRFCCAQTAVLKFTISIKIKTSAERRQIYKLSALPLVWTYRLSLLPSSESGFLARNEDICREHTTITAAPSKCEMQL